jgi:RNA polymerase sigma factor (sigma-70 family)
MMWDETVEQAYRGHAAAIRGKAFQLTRDPELAADVVQDAFLRLFVEARAGRLPDNVPAWLYRTSANLVISRSRRVDVARRYAPRLLHENQPEQPEDIALDRELGAELSVALSTLPPAHRIALVMAAHGASGVEIASRIGRSHLATRAVISRARGRLRCGLGDSSLGSVEERATPSASRFRGRAANG